MSVEKQNVAIPELVKGWVVGNKGVGKTALIALEKDGIFSRTMEGRGVDFIGKNYPWGSKKIKGQWWDSPYFGSEAMGAGVVFLVYDVTWRESFQDINKWIERVERSGSFNRKMVLIGNKCDKVDEKAVETHEGQKLADQYGIPFFETSAITGRNVNEAFRAGIKLVVGAPKQEAAPKEEKSSSWFSRLFTKTSTPVDKGASDKSEQKKEVAPKPKSQAELAAENSLLREQIKRLEAERENEKLRAELAQLKAAGSSSSSSSSSKPSKD